MVSVHPKRFIPVPALTFWFIGVLFATLTLETEVRSDIWPSGKLVAHPEGALELREKQLLLRRQSGNWQVCRVKRFVWQECLVIFATTNKIIGYDREVLASEGDIRENEHTGLYIVLETADKLFPKIEDVKIDDRLLASMQSSDDVYVKVEKIKPPYFSFVPPEGPPIQHILPAGILELREKQILVRKSPEGWQLCRVKRFVYVDHLVPAELDGKMVSLLREEDMYDEAFSRELSGLFVVLEVATPTFSSMEQIRVEEKLLNDLETSDEILVKATEFKPPRYSLLEPLSPNPTGTNHQSSAIGTNESGTVIQPTNSRPVLTNGARQNPPRREGGGE